MKGRILSAKTGFVLSLVIVAMLLASGAALAERVRCDGGVCKGSRDDDRLLGTDKRDIIYAFRGDDKLYGVRANDDLYGFDGTDLLKGGPGKDKLNGGDGVLDELHGGDGDDLLKDGETEFRWMLSGDTMFGEAGNDTLIGKYGNNHLLGGDGDDTLMGGFEDDQFLGGTGDDALEGKGGGDLYLYAAGWGHDTISDNAGASGSFGNSVYFNHASDPITADLTVTLTPGPGPEATDGTNTVEWQEAGAVYSVIGGRGDDTITGDADNNQLYGEDGADTITAGDGDDRVDASDPHSDTGDDVDCGPGSDTVSVDPGNIDRIANCETDTVGSE